MTARGVTEQRALEMAAAARHDAEQAARARLLSVAATYDDDARKFAAFTPEMQQVMMGPGDWTAGRWALLYKTVAQELAKVAGGGTTEPRVWPTDQVVTRLGDATVVIDASRCIVLATPERRITVTNVALWREALITAKVTAAAAEDGGGNGGD